MAYKRFALLLVHWMMMQQLVFGLEWEQSPALQRMAIEALDSMDSLWTMELNALNLNVDELDVD